MIPQFPEFKKLELSDKEEIEFHTKKLPPYSDFNFVSLWSWDTKGETALSILNGNLIVRFNDYLSKEPFYSFIGTNKVEETINTVTEFSAKQGIGYRLRLVPDEVMALYKSEDFISIPDEDNFDYIYNIKDFLSCEGKKYETQRNQINRFEKKYPNARAEIFTSFAPIKERILRLEQQWKLNKIKQEKVIEFRSESEALWRIFDLKQENFVTVCVFVDDVMIGFCVSELLPESPYALSHFAKADISFAGVYSYMLHKTCAALAEKDRVFLNYEQDLGLVQLRHSKSAFRPCSFLKKHFIIKQ